MAVKQQPFRADDFPTGTLVDVPLPCWILGPKGNWCEARRWSASVNLDSSLDCRERLRKANMVLRLAFLMVVILFD